MAGSSRQFGSFSTTTRSRRCPRGNRMVGVGGKRDAEDCREEGSRYDGITVVFGREFQQRLSESRVFLVGAGAIGCEMLKNLALLGVGTSPRGKIIVTDMDRIERSNLSRQFLFRGNDVGQSKARTAARAVQKMNPAVHVECWEFAASLYQIYY